MELDSPVLSRRRAALFAAVLAADVVWFAVAPHLSGIGLWPSVILVACGVMPFTLLLVLLLLPLWRWRWRMAAMVALAALALVASELGWGLVANFAKLGAATFAGWSFLALFEELSWVVIIAAVIPFVDAISVWRGPTHSITTHHFEVYTSVSVAFLVPGGGAAYLGPPDVLFYALFLAAAARWGLRVGWTWVGLTGMYGLTVIVANAAGVDGLPALPFASAGFLLPNADLLWRRLRRPA